MLSIIIPCLNEARTLPALLQALQTQTAPPGEIIVADAGSKDGTVELARSAGVKVVPGGKPAAGRNAGVRAAQGDLYLFLDADVLPQPDFIASYLQGFERQGLDTAACLLAPLEEDPATQLICEATNLYMQLILPVSPHAPGCCILTRRSIFEQVGGFDESLAMSEDHAFVQKAAECGKFGLVTDTRLRISMRRLEKEGIVRLALKYLYCELHALAGKPLKHAPFVYEFGNFDEAPGRKLVDVARLRQSLDRIENPLVSLSARGRATLDALGQVRLSTEKFDRRLHALLPAELIALNQYLRRRHAALQTTTRSFVSGTIKFIQESRPVETIRLLDWKPGYFKSWHSDGEEEEIK